MQSNECLQHRQVSRALHTWASYQIRNIAGCACAGCAGNVFTRRRLQRKPLVSDTGMHHGTCVTHVPWCMSGSLASGGGENVPGIPGACAPAIFCIWLRAHGLRKSPMFWRLGNLTARLAGHGESLGFVCCRATRWSLEVLDMLCHDGLLPQWLPKCYTSKTVGWKLKQCVSQFHMSNFDMKFSTVADLKGHF